MPKLTPHDVTEDARLLIETLLEADPSTFDPEADFTRLTSFTCPECKSTNCSAPDGEGLVDCYECGIWFNPYHDRNRAALHQKLPEAAPPPVPPEPEDPEEKYQAYIDAHGAGPPRKEIKNIETTSDYREFEERVKDFFRNENITNLDGVADEQGNTESHFSWRPCDCCQRSLGGDRYEARGYNSAERFNPDHVGEYNICTDCLYYCAYGQLDDTTMMNLKGDLKRPEESLASTI
jgi:hypothetical protein